MKKIIYLLTSCALIGTAVSLNGAQKLSAAGASVRPIYCDNVIKVETWTYTDGVPTTLTSYEEISYNNNGYKSKHEYFTVENGIATSTVRFEYAYDAKGNLTTESYYMFTNIEYILYSKTESTFDDSNVITRSTYSVYNFQTSVLDLSESTEYDDGLITTITSFNTDKTVNKIVTYTYDAQKRVSKIATQKYQGATAGTYGEDVYNYDGLNEGALYQYVRTSYTDNTKTNPTISKRYTYYDFGYTIENDANCTGTFTPGAKYVEVSNLNECYAQLFNYNSVTQDYTDKEEDTGYELTVEDGHITKAVRYEYTGAEKVYKFEILYTYRTIEKPTDDKPSSNAGVIIGSIVGGLVVIFVGLFFVWKYELEKALENETKKRLLKVLDVVYKPIYKTFFEK